MGPEKPEIIELVLLCSTRGLAGAAFNNERVHMKNCKMEMRLSFRRSHLHGIAFWSSLKSDTALMDPTNSIARKFKIFFVFAVFHACCCLSMRLIRICFPHFTFYALLVGSVKLFSVLWILPKKFFPLSIAFKIKSRVENKWIKHSLISNMFLLDYYTTKLPENMLCFDKI